MHEQYMLPVQQPSVTLELIVPQILMIFWKLSFKREHNNQYSNVYKLNAESLKVTKFKYLNEIQIRAYAAISWFSLYTVSPLLF